MARFRFERPLRARPVLTRKALKYEWANSPFEGWARRYIQNNFWRVRYSMGTEDDALQECAMLFVKLSRKYAVTVNDPRWMMALFKTTVTRHFATLSSWDSDNRPSGAAVGEIAEGVDYSLGPLSVALAQGTDDLRTLVRALANAPSDFLTLIFEGSELLYCADPQTAADARAAINRRIRRLLRITGEQRDPIGELLRYLQQEVTEDAT